MSTPETREYSLQEIVDTIPYDTAAQIDRAQKVGIEWQFSDPEIIEMLDSNIGFYEEIEPLLDKDALLKNFTSEISDRGGATPEQARRIRHRRTILARMILEGAAVSIALEQHPTSRSSAA